MNATRALLDQLMGPNRNARGGDNDSPTSHWGDKNVCSWFLCDFCPHDLFTNTKEDLGVCPKIHSDLLKEEFLKQSESVKNRYNMKYLRYLQGLQIRGRQRVSRAQERLRMQAPNHFGDPELRRRTKEIKRMVDDLRNLEKEVEELGEQGKVQEAQLTLQKQEKMKQKLHSLKEQHQHLQLRSSQLEARVKPFIVCDVCGGFIVDENPSSSRRVVAHKAGRMHQGFAKIFAKVEELEESLKGVSIEDSPERSVSRGRDRGRRRREGGDRKERERSRRSRDRSRGRRRKESSSSSRRPRSRSYERRRSRRH